MNSAEQQARVWTQCKRCQTSNEKSRWAAAHLVCPACGFHLRINFRKRLQFIIDENSFIEHALGLSTEDPLNWNAAGQNYPVMISKAREKNDVDESFCYGRASISQMETMIGGFEFRFLGGTLGSVAGEKVARMLETAAAESLPAIIFTASGGARMQEGMLSLMQMSKIATSIARFNRSGLPLITVICDPTTGGVGASLAFMGDVVLAEPGALAGFAGPRVVLQTIGEEMPAGIQSTDRLCTDGFIDEIVPRARLREVLTQRLQSFR